MELDSFRGDLKQRLGQILSRQPETALRPRDLVKILGTSRSHLTNTLNELEDAGVIVSKTLKKKRFVSLNTKSRAGREVAEYFSACLKKRRTAGSPPSKSDLYYYRGTVEKVVDGDTLDLRVDLGFYLTSNLRFRLAKINTAEIFGVSKSSAAYRKGIRAKRFLEDWLEGREVWIRSKRTGKFGRWLAEVWCDGISVNELLVKKGLARKY